MLLTNLTPPPIPVVVNSPARSHHVQPLQDQPITRSQLREQTMHMINSAVFNALMPRPVTATTNTPPAIGYAFVVHQLVLSKLATNHFIGAIINKETGAVLEYRHLVKNPATKSVWETSFANKNRMPVPGDTRSQGHKHVILHTEIASPHQQMAHFRPNRL